MYFVSVVLFLFILPLISIAAEFALSQHPQSIILLVGKWFVFWGVGIRLLIAGVRQVTQPQFTAEEIFRIRDRGSFAIVREVGFANQSMGVLGTCAAFRAGWLVPAALVGGLYYGLAGIGHVFHKAKNSKEYTAMVSDLLISLVLLGFVVNRLV